MSGSWLKGRGGEDKERQFLGSLPDGVGVRERATGSALSFPNQDFLQDPSVLGTVRVIRCSHQGEQGLCLPEEGAPKSSQSLLAHQEQLVGLGVGSWGRVGGAKGRGIVVILG